MWLLLPVAGLVALLSALILTPLVRRMALAFGVLDHPSGRKIHRTAVPRLGGVAVFAAWLIAVIVVVVLQQAFHVTLSARLWPLMWLAGLSVLFGFCDDVWDLPGPVKILSQIAVASLVFLAAARIDRLSNPFGGEFWFPVPVSYVVTVLWVIGMMNAMNLIDGLDGLATGIAGITAIGLIASGSYTGSYTSMMMLAALAGACLGFLRYNFHPAAIFLGDSGSQFLGFLFAVAALVGDQYKAATAASLLIPLTALMLPIYDTGLAFVRRLRGRRSVFRADKYHLHHRLLKMGLSHPQVVVVLYLVSLYLNCLAFLFVLIREQYAIMLLAVLALGLFMGMQTLRFIEYRLRQVYRMRRARLRQLRAR